MKKLAIALMIVSLVASVAVAKDKPQPTMSMRGMLDCSNAIPITCGESVVGNNTGLPNNVEEYGCVGWTETGGEAIYELVLDGEYVVNATLSGLGADLDIFFLDGCEEMNCLGYGNIASSAIAGPGTYYIVVDGYNGAEDFFTLTVGCEPVVPLPEPLAGGNTCADATDLQVAGMSTFSTDLSQYTDDYQGYTCFSWGLPGGDAVYKIDLEAGQDFTATMNGTCDIAMYVFADCVSEDCIASADNGTTGGEEVLSFTAALGGTYYLVLDTFPVAGCEVVLTIDAPVATEESSWDGVKAMYR